MDNPAVPLDNHPVHRPFRKIYDFLASAKLAMALLVAILVICLVTVTFLPREKTVQIVFSTLWFNALLVLLEMNIACCFSGRVFGRRITVVSFGMILFHISFVTILLGVVYNSLFYFRGTIRLTEGETLQSGDSKSYDKFEQGRFFSFLRLKGETKLIKLHHDYRVDNEDKRAAYEIEVGDGDAKKSGIIYVTHNLTHKGFSYYPDVEGYSLLVMLADERGNDMYGAHIPLQSLKQKNGSFLYTTGTKEGAGPFPYPQEPLRPFMGLQLALMPAGGGERSGTVYYSVYPFVNNQIETVGKPVVEGRATFGKTFSVLNYGLSVREIRYWTTMVVRYEPGKPIVLASLCICLLGITITSIGRMIKRRPSRL